MAISTEWQSAKTLFSTVKGHGKVPSLLYFLLAINLVLIGFHWVNYSTDYLPGQHFSLNQDRGLPELFQWIQIWATAILLWGLSFRRQSRLYGSWAMIFLLLLVNDITLIHERGGMFLARRLGLPAGLGLQAGDYGELIIYGLAAIVVAWLVRLGYQKNRDVIARSTTVCLLLFVVSLLIASEFFDVVRLCLEALFQRNLTSFWTEVFVVIEEGSELMISSLSLWFVWRLWVTFAPLPRGVAPKP